MRNAGNKPVDLRGIALVTVAPVTIESMHKPSDILEANREIIRHIVAAHRGANPRVFDSTLRRTDTAHSDLDLLVDVLPGTGLLELGAMQFEL